LDSLDGRVAKLEAKQYDTKPIWERALAAISEVSVRLDETNRRLGETNSRLDETNSRLDVRIDETNSRLDIRIDETNARIDETKALMVQGFEQLRSEVKAGFASLQEQTGLLIHDVYWKVDALNSNVLKIQADQQYFNSRLREVETTVKESSA
jgi:hypothetical protein